MNRLLSFPVGDLPPLLTSSMPWDFVDNRFNAWLYHRNALHYARGEHRACVSLLYRASLSRLIDRYEIAFRASHTETECAALVTARGIDSLSEYFWQLTDVWRRLAYGHQVPGSDTVQGLCADWHAELADEQR